MQALLVSGVSTVPTKVVAQEGLSVREGAKSGCAFVARSKWKKKACDCVRRVLSLRASSPVSAQDLPPGPASTVATPGPRSECRDSTSK